MPVVHLNGTDLFYLDVGTGLPCLVMHGGLGLDHTCLHPSLDPLIDGFRLIYYDHRGNGRSGRPPIHTLTFEQLAADAEALRVCLHLERIAILGHSVGGMIALHYALQYPQHLTRLILVNTTPAWDYGNEIVEHALRKGATPEMLAALDGAVHCADDEELRRAFDLLGPLYFHEFTPDVFKSVLGRTKYSGTATGRCFQLLPSYNLSRRLGAIAAPTLIIAGQDDFVTPLAQAQRLKEGIPNADLVVLERSGHFPWVEEPREFFAAVLGWLQRDLQRS